MLSPKSLIGRRRAPRRSQSDDLIGTRTALWPVGTISQLLFSFFFLQRAAFKPCPDISRQSCLISPGWQDTFPRRSLKASFLG